MARIGADTGFLIGVAQDNPVSLTFWEGILRGEDELLVPTISIAEFLTYFFRRGKGEMAEAFVQLLLSLPNARIVPLSLQIAKRAARYRHGLGLHVVDAVIVATFVEHECQKMLTTDAHFNRAHQQGIIEVVLLR